MEFYTKNQWVERLIRAAIASGEIRPGERLLQVELAKKMGISSTPIREALRRLEAQGILMHEPNKGVRVAETKPEDALEIYLIRGALEGLATELAVRHMTDEELTKIRSLCRAIDEATNTGKLRRLQRLNHSLHFAIYDAARMPRLRQMIEILWTLYPWDTLYVIPGRAQLSYQEHQALLKALEARDTEAAGAAMREHINAGCRSVMDYIATYPPEARQLASNDDGDSVGEEE